MTSQSITRLGILKSFVGQNAPGIGHSRLSGNQGFALVVTFWNSYDIPISLSPAYNSIRFLKIPYQINNLNMTVNGATTVIGTVKLVGVSSTSFGGQFAANYVTLRAGSINPVVLRPGEVLVYAQPPNTLPQPVDASGGVTAVDGKAGYSFGGGISYKVKNSSGVEVTIPAPPTASQAVNLEFDGITPTTDTISQGVAGLVPVSMNHCETYLFEDRKSLGPHLGIGGVLVDFWRGLPPYISAKTGRFTADQRPNVFKSFPAGSVMIEALATGTHDLKKPFLYYAYDAKTEEDSLCPGQFLSRLNPSAPLVEFAVLSDERLDAMPFEVRVESNTSSGLNSVIDQDLATGRGYFGGGTTGNFGSRFVTTHSVLRKPIISMAALQHSMANGFIPDKPDANAPAYGYSPANDHTNHSIRLPMLPQISHAIGNSLAPALLAKDKTEGTLSHGRAIADHSYLANKALWNDWFFSGIAPQKSPVNPAGDSQKAVASGFLNGNRKLPVARFTPELGSQTAPEALNHLFSGNDPRPEATDLVASLLCVESMFSINSTSVEAWKVALAGLKDHPITIRDDKGLESIFTAPGSSPVVGLITPIAPILSTPSGSFIVRTDGEKRDRSGTKGSCPRLVRGGGRARLQLRGFLGRTGNGDPFPQSCQPNLRTAFCHPFLSLAVSRGNLKTSKFQNP